MGEPLKKHFVALKKALQVSLLKLSRSAKGKIWEEQRVWITAASVAGLLIGVRLTGVLQPWEWALYDQFMRWRDTFPLFNAPVKIDDRILIIGIDEQDLQQIEKWPVPDQVMAKLLTKLDSYQPRVIGLDIYRDLPVEPGNQQLQQVMRRLPNLIGIERLPEPQSAAVRPPAILAEKNQVGFNNVLLDSDGKVRRNLLYQHINGQPHTSFSLQVAIAYLQKQGVTPEAAAENPRFLQLGTGVFHQFQGNDGAYIRADERGYQILADFQGVPGSFRTVSMRDVMAGKVEPELIKDKIVLIGSTATSLRDFFATSHSVGLGQPRRLMAGVEVKANFISQFLDLAMGERQLVRVWSDVVEGLWIGVWSAIGAFLSWRLRSGRAAFGLLVAIGTATGGAYTLLIWNWWIPLVPSVVAMTVSASAIASYLAHQREELERSKEFLQNVIDTIPDPVFVKDKSHRWIVLNQAFCQLIGYPLTDLMNKSVFDVFTQEQAQQLWRQDELVFETQFAHEQEEELTDARGRKYQIATKRSLHQDSAGNLFLVGVIRDITERKRMEEELKRVANELAQSNAELKLSEDHLRYLAYHDALTGLANRKLFEERLDQAVEWASVNQHRVALLFLDLDGFKQINDGLGHDIGDLLLRAVAGRLTGCLRGSDTVARLGGDEFTVILPAIPTQADAVRVAEKILAAVSKPYAIAEQSINITTSIGIALYPQHGVNSEALLKVADAAMYSAKEVGKNQYALPTEDLGTEESAHA